MGQFSFLTTITSLVIAARLRKFDMALEEAALNLGATRTRVLATVTLPFLFPALFSAFIVAFLVSFENFNTTLMLVGSDAPLSITMYDRMAKAGSTPVLNAVAVFLMLASGLLAFLSVAVQSRQR
jgi:spermidine/putrescine transport system permease protein